MSPNGTFGWYDTTPMRLARMLASAAQLYHGYKRNNGSIGWAIGWSLLPVFIGTPLMLAEGFAKPKR